MSGAARDWDAASYDRVSDPQVEWARAVLERLPLAGDEVVLDAGCGSGRVTRLLIERLDAAAAARAEDGDGDAGASRGGVIAVDSAPSMVERARATLGGRATVLEGDLGALELDEPVDAVFSNAVFHWVTDHDRLFARLHAALRPGGRLVAQCGGAGNVAAFVAEARAVAAEPPYAEHLAGWREPWHFAGAEETRARLERAGFDRVSAWLQPQPVEPPEPREFICTVCLGHHLAALPDELRDGFVDAVDARCPRPLRLDYVRLNIDARRPG